MIRDTSKAAFIDITESGVALSQAGKILAIVHDLKSSSLQEIMAEYRKRHGIIEYGSISGRVNLLKDPLNPQVQEGSPRACTISGKKINPIEIYGVCRHNLYRDKTRYQQLGSIGKDIVFKGMIIDNCANCGEDLSPYRLVPVKTKSEYMKGLNNEY